MCRIWITTNTQNKTKQNLELGKSRTLDFYFLDVKQNTTMK